MVRITQYGTEMKKPMSANSGWKIIDSKCEYVWILDKFV